MQGNEEAALTYLVLYSQYGTGTNLLPYRLELPEPPSSFLGVKFAHWGDG